MEWWQKLKYLGLMLGLAIAANFVFLSGRINALGPNNGECVQTGDSIICPDLYCVTQSLTCDPAGNQCFCKPAPIAGADDNQSCEIATGSQIFFERDSNNNISEIVLSNGVWRAIVNKLSFIYGDDLSDYGIDVSRRAIIFTPKDPSTTGDDFRHYSSDFLTPLKDWDKFKNYILRNEGIEIKKPKVLEDESAVKLGMGFDAYIPKDSDSGYIFNQTYELTLSEELAKTANERLSGDMEKKFGNRQICGVDLFAQNQFFYSKGSPMSMPAIDNPLERTACLGTSELLLRLVVPTIDSTFVNKSWLVTAYTSRNCFGSNLEEKSPFLLPFVHYTGRTATDTTTRIASSLIVPSGGKRPIYQTYQDNRFRGIIFPRDDPNREKNVKKIEEECDKLKSDANFDDPTTQFDCEPSGILKFLKGNPSKSYSDIIAEEMSKKDKLNCQLVSPSFGANVQNLKIQPSWTTHKLISGVSKTENEINKLLPKPLIKICEDYHKANERKRILCKYNSLNCYTQNISPDLSGGDICAFMEDNPWLRLGRWAMCPVLKTGVLTADSSQKMIEDIFHIDQKTLADPKIDAVWKAMRNIANIILIIAFLVLIFSQLTGFGLSNYQIKTTLPKILIMAVFINLSLTIAQAGLDIANIMGGSISSLFQYIAKLIGFSLNPATNGAFDGATFGAIATKAAMVAGILVLVIPMFLTILFGILTLFLLLSLRQGLVIFLALVSPIVFASGAISNNKKMISNWLKFYIVILLIYPVAQIIYSSSLIAKIVLENLGSGGLNSDLLKLVALTLPCASLVAIPFVAKAMFKGASSLAAKISSGVSGAGQLAQTQARAHRQKSYFRQSLGSFVGTGISNLLMGSTKGRRLRMSQSGQPFKPRFGGRFFNYISQGAGHSMGSRVLARNQAAFSAVSGVIGDDVVLLKALIMDQGAKGSYYNHLSKHQQGQYDLVVSQGLQHLNRAAPILLAKMGITDQALYQKAFENAARSGVQMGEYVGASFGTAKKSGDVEAMSILRAQMDIANSRHIIASDTIRNASDNLARADNRDLRHFIINNGIAAITQDQINKQFGRDSVESTTFRQISSMTQRDLLASAVNAESIDTRANEALIRKGVGLLALGESSFASGELSLETLTDTQKDNLAFAARTLELANQNRDIATDGIYIDFKDVFKEIAPNSKLDNKVYKDIINNTKTESLPDGWTEDRSETRPITRHEIREQAKGQIKKMAFRDFYSKVFDEPRTADRNIGAETSQYAKDALLEEISQPIGDITKPTEVMKHRIYEIGRDWNLAPVKIQNVLAEPIIESIYNSLGQEFAKQGMNRTQIEQAVNMKHGVANLTDAKNKGVREMLKLIGITPDEVDR